MDFLHGHIWNLALDILAGVATLRSPVFLHTLNRRLHLLFSLVGPISSCHQFVALFSVSQLFSMVFLIIHFLQIV